MTQWIDFSPYGRKLKVLTLPGDRGRMLVLFPVEQMAPDLPDDGLSRLGFRRSEKNPAVWTAPQRAFSLAEFQTVAPKVFMREFAPEDIIFRAARDMSDIERAAGVAARQERLIGRNALGQEVWEGEDGRFIRLSGNNVVLERDHALARPYAFLRGSTPRDLAGCADAYAGMILSGQVRGFGDLRRFAADIHDVDTLSDPPSPQAVTLLENLRDAVDDAIARAMGREKLSREESVGPHLWQRSRRYHEYHPTLGMGDNILPRPDFRVTPAPIVVSASFLLGNTHEIGAAHIHIPNVKNGALLSCLPPTSIIHAVAMTSRQAARARLVARSAGLINADITVQSVDSPWWAMPAGSKVAPSYVLSDVGYEKIGATAIQTVDGETLTVTRQDHLVMLETLRTRADIGRSVFIVSTPKDEDERNERRAVVEAICRTHVIEGVASIDSALYAGRVGASPALIFSIGPRSPVPTPMPTARRITSLDALWDWSVGVVARREPLSAIIEQQAITSEAGNGADQFDAPYIAASRVAPATLVVPRNLDDPMRRAMSDFISRHGDVDTFVANQMGWDLPRLGEMLAPEQVDDLAMMMNSVLSGREFLLGNGAGTGKTRPLACLSWWAINRMGMRVILSTKSASLFTDFWGRDVQRLGFASEIKPWVLNNGIKVRDIITREVILTSPDPEDSARVMESKEWPEGHNLILCTYSQFGTPGAKCDWARAIARPGVLMINDESQGRASRTAHAALVYHDMETKVGAVIHSSATASKDERSASTYDGLIPTLSDRSPHNAMVIAAAIKSGDDMFYESLLESAGADGIYRRLGHPVNGVQESIYIDEGSKPFNENYMAALSPILANISFLSNDIKAMVSRLNLEAERAVVAASGTDSVRSVRSTQFQAVSFASPLFRLTSMIMMSLRLEGAVNSALSAVERNRKPLIMVENTLESMMRDLVPDGVSLQEGHEIEFPDFKMSLRRMLAQLFSIKMRDHRGVSSSQDIRELLNDAGFNATCMAALEAINSAIDALPDLPASPFDYLRERLEARGLRVGEASGRSLMWENGVLRKRQRETPADVIAKFNAGQFDILLTNITTGVSANSDPNFLDSRGRTLIKIQPAVDIDKEIQGDNRHRRRGDLVAAETISVHVGHPGEYRLIAQRNSNLRSMSVYTTSSRDHRSVIDHVPDLFNPVGDSVVAEMLDADPALRARLGFPELQGVDPTVPLAERYKRGDINGYARRLMSYLIMLMPDESEAVYDRLINRFNLYLASLEALGRNPLRPYEIPGTFSVENEEVFQHVSFDPTSAFESPVRLRTLKGEISISPMTSDEIIEMVTQGSMISIDVDNEAGLVNDWANDRISKIIGSNVEFIIKYKPLLAGVDVVQNIDEKAIKSKENLIGIVNNIGAAIDRFSNNPDEIDDRKLVYLRAFHKTINSAVEDIGSFEKIAANVLKIIPGAVVNIPTRNIGIGEEHDRIRSFNAGSASFGYTDERAGVIDEFMNVVERVAGADTRDAADVLAGIPADADRSSFDDDVAPEGDDRAVTVDLDEADPDGADLDGADLDGAGASADAPMEGEPQNEEQGGPQNEGQPGAEQTVTTVKAVILAARGRRGSSWIDWTVDLVPVGGERKDIHPMRMSELIRLIHGDVEPGLNAEEPDALIDEIDHSPRGVKTVRATVLVGNMPYAIGLNEIHKMGVPAFYVDKSGVRHRCICAEHESSMELSKISLPSKEIILDTVKMIQNFVDVIAASPMNDRIVNSRFSMIRSALNSVNDSFGIIGYLPNNMNPKALEDFLIRFSHQGRYSTRENEIDSVKISFKSLPRQLSSDLSNFAKINGGKMSKTQIVFSIDYLGDAIEIFSKANVQFYLDCPWRDVSMAFRRFVNKAVDHRIARNDAELTGIIDLSQERGLLLSGTPDGLEPPAPAAPPAPSATNDDPSAPAYDHEAA